jgi:hypothetical protein
MKLLALVFAAAAVAMSVPVAAQPTTPPKNTCAKPEEYPGRLASETVRRLWNKSIETYGDCIKKYAAEQKVLAEAAIKAGNEAVDEYNAVVSKAKDDMEKAR